MSEKTFDRLRTLFAVGIALCLAFAVVFVVSRHPVETLLTFVLGPLRSWRYAGNLIEVTIPLIFTGLATAILFQGSLFNLGAEGTFYLGGLVAAAVALYVPAGPWVTPILALLAATAAGTAGAALPGIMKARWNANELVTSLMLNGIFAGLGLYVLNYAMRDPAMIDVASYELPLFSRLPNLLPGTRVHVGLLIALATVLVTFVFLYRTRSGFSLRMTGINRRFAEYAGINAYGAIVLSHLVSGAIGGLGGSVEVLGMYSRFRWATPTGLGLDGALVAMLAKNKPGSVVGAALFLAYIRVGADIMARQSDVPAEAVAIIQAVIILLVSAERFLSGWYQRRLVKGIAP